MTSQQPPLWRRAVAELLGTSLLVMIVVGSGIAAQQLSPNDVGLQLLQNSTATVLGLTVLILVFGPVSGAHFNPVVSLVDLDPGPAQRRRTDPAGTWHLHRCADSGCDQRQRCGERHV